MTAPSVPTPASEIHPELPALLEALNAGERITGDSPLHQAMHATAQASLRLCGEINGAYPGEERLHELLCELTGTEVPESVKVFPPLTADFGRNLRLGERVFLNSGCRIQDQGGMEIGEDCLIGHNAVFATLNHDVDPEHRADMIPAPIHLGRKVWLGANVTVLPGVTIGDHSVVGAGSVVTQDVPANTIVVGTPAREVRRIEA